MKIRVLVIVVLASTWLLAAAALAQKLVCVSKPELKGEETVSSCLERGERFAVMDENNLVKILTPEEADLSRAFNPRAFESRAFGVKYLGRASKIPPLPVSPEQQ